MLVEPVDIVIGTVVLKYFVEAAAEVAWRRIAFEVASAAETGNPANYYANC